MCSVEPEDAGEIHFVARDVASTAYLEVEGLSAVRLKLAGFSWNVFVTDVVSSSSQSSPSPS